jgi:hypothetical protein
MIKKVPIGVIRAIQAVIVVKESTSVSNNPMKGCLSLIYIREIPTSSPKTTTAGMMLLERAEKIFSGISGAFQANKSFDIYPGIIANNNKTSGT